MNSAKLGFVIFQVSQLWGEGVTKGIWTMDPMDACKPLLPFLSPHSLL